MRPAILGPATDDFSKIKVLEQICDSENIFSLVGGAEKGSVRLRVKSRLDPAAMNSLIFLG